MNATAHTNEQEAIEANRRISLIGGLFFLLTFIHVGILFLYNDVLNNANFILGEGSVAPVQLGAMIEIITIIANVATGVVLFQVLRRQQLGASLGYVAVRIFESCVIAVGTICLLATVTLRESFAGATGTEAANLSMIGSSLVAVRDWTFVFGPGLCSGLGNGLLLGYLMFRSGLVPRKMALLGLIGGPVSLIGVTFVVFGAWEQDAPQQFLFTAGEIAWELSLSFYLIFKGFRRTPITTQMASERPGMAYGDLAAGVA
jgi:hypothetical protein